MSKTPIKGLPVMKNSEKEAEASESAISPELDTESKDSAFGEGEENVNDLPQMKDPGVTHNVVKTKKVSKNGIEVIATAKGFYNQDRKFPGDVFKMKTIEEAASSWVKCMNESEQDEVDEFLKTKRAGKK